MKRAIFYIFCFLFSSLVWGGSNSKPESVREKNLIISNDISNQQVTSFAEDAFGHIWISTIRGLNK